MAESSNAMVSGLKEQDGLEPTQTDGSPFTFLPPAPVVLFCRNSPSLKQVIMQGRPISPKSASKSKASSGQVAPRASTQARKVVRKVAARKTLKRKAPVQENLQTSTEENSSEDGQSRQRDTNPGNSERSTTQSQTDSPSSTRQRLTPEPAATPAPIKTGSRVKRRCVKRVRKGSQVSSPSQEVSNGCDPSSLLTFDPNPSSQPLPKQMRSQALTWSSVPFCLKALLSSSIEILVENPRQSWYLDEVQLISHDTVKLASRDPAGFQVRSAIGSPKNYPSSRSAPVESRYCRECQRLNEKKIAVLDAKTDTSANSAELATLRKELESLEKKVRMTKQLIQEKETFIARSREEAQGLTLTRNPISEIRAPSGQQDSKDEDDLDRDWRSGSYPYTPLRS
ncbi:hypothetical protein QYE76_064403 [Lolium multiflorum]|uniref:Uncharacterized protein n=1 Tax=Lolium multiflorum TaxID=4521 RepID=A0AAD8S7L5_LOLMU|nr:hypothetical protein QYE76_064403 [Lolium multiflorum]